MPRNSSNPILDYDMMRQAETKHPKERGIDVRAPRFVPQNPPSKAKVGSVDVTKFGNEKHYDEKRELSEENLRMKFVKVSEFQGEA